MKHLLGITGLTRADLEELIDLAAGFAEVQQRDIPKVPALRRNTMRAPSKVPKAAYMPAVRSAMDTPQRAPRLPSSPVMLIMPLSPCTTRSIAARSRYGPS